jgi:radical SAM protein with 4Fe4S-binding SPASM domain
MIVSWPNKRHGGPKEAVIAITHNCNAKCIMCNIWKQKPGEEVLPSIYEKLPNSLRTINISGGEPFLRKDLPEIINIIQSRCKRPRMVISTNGLLPGVIEKQIKQIVESKNAIGVRVSIDGMREVHDKVRGLKGAFVNGTESLRILEGLGIRDLGIAFTAMAFNLSDIQNVYDLSRKLRIQFALSVAYKSSVYFKNVDEDYLIDYGELTDRLDYIVNRELRSLEPKRWFRAYFEHALVGYASGEKKLQNCTAGEDFFYLDPLGNVYPCTVLDMRLGNLQEKSFDEIWSSKETQKVRDYIKRCPHNCWMVCNAVPMIKKHPYIPLSWIMKNKFNLHAGRPIARR